MPLHVVGFIRLVSRHTMRISQRVIYVITIRDPKLTTSLVVCPNILSVDYEPRSQAISAEMPARAGTLGCSCVPIAFPFRSSTGEERVTGSSNPCTIVVCQLSKEK